MTLINLHCSQRIEVSERILEDDYEFRQDQSLETAHREIERCARLFNEIWRRHISDWNIVGMDGILKQSETVIDTEAEVSAWPVTPVRNANTIMNAFGWMQKIVFGRYCAFLFRTFLVLNEKAVLWQWYNTKCYQLPREILIRMESAKFENG